MTRFTVAICTRDRAESLRLTLASLARSLQALSGDDDVPDWELLVIDNGSSDHTQTVIESFAHTLPLRSLVEPRAGLSRARNRALAGFRGTWLVFTDDDAEVEPRYLGRLDRALAAHRGMDFFGGRSLVHWAEPRPAWLVDPELAFIEGLLCHFDEGDGDHPLADDDPLPFGVNMGLHRRVVDALDGFRTDLGPGTPARGEETEYLERARAAGFVGWYLGRVAVRHRADPARFTIAALYRHGRAKGRGHALLDPSRRGSFSAELRQLAGAVGQALRGKGGTMRVAIVNAGMQRGLREARRAGGLDPARPGRG